jgi:hypothetical protein
LHEATDGAEGAELQGKPVVILTTTGARSGRIRARAGRDIPIVLFERCPRPEMPLADTHPAERSRT